MKSVSVFLAQVILCFVPNSHVIAAELFSKTPVWSSGTKISGGDGIARFIDFDRDGDPDFLTSAPSPKRWVLYRNDGGVIGETPVWESKETTDCDHIDVLDFNHDGWPDLAATHESHCTLYTNDNGKFPVTPDWETAIIANANQIDFGDYDQDGDLDMLMAGGEPINGIALFENQTGTPSQTVTRKLGHKEYSETGIFADVDSDGDLDILAGYRGGKTVHFENNGGEFDGGKVFYDNKIHPWTQRLYCEDVDDDGVPEVYCAKGPWGRQVGASVQLVKEADKDGMQVQWQSGERTAYHAFAFDDVDNDGDDDLIAADYANGGAVAVYLNEQGRLATDPVWQVRTSGPAHEAVLADLDQDGDLDLAVGCRDQAHLFLNQSSD